jgi:hypothetical protein
MNDDALPKADGELGELPADSGWPRKTERPPLLALADQLACRHGKVPRFRL